MAYAVIEFLEAGEPRATLCRPDHGQPTGADGVMDPLSAFIEETSRTMIGQGSPGALYMAQLFTAREVEAGRAIRVVGGQGELGITAEEVRALAGPGYLYEVIVGPEGDRTPPSILVKAPGNGGG
ncbi:MAG TPA: hypothetical protein VFR81_13455 [Longimicrobium sp.]|nr:hypothetical protein [Longimicrobium sp.]